jgi:plastocyanin
MVGEREFSITPSSIALTKPGTYKFKITNNGMIGHALEVEGHGVEQKTGTIQPGKTATLQVSLTKAGSYEVYCPIDGHRNKGMEATLTVGGTAAPAVGGTSTEGTTTGQTSTSKGGYGY